MLKNELKLIPLTRDFMFKRIFSLNRNLLKKFLISVLKLDINPDNTNLILESNELIKSKDKEYHKTVDMLVKLDNKLNEGFISIDIEINSSRPEDINLRNWSYLTKIISDNIEKGNDMSFYDNCLFLQLNLNIHRFKENIGEKVYSIKEETTNEEYVSNVKIISKSLDYYYNFYYTNKEMVSNDVIWLALLNSKNFKELEEMSDLVMSKKEKDQFLKSCKDACGDKLLLSEWEADKMAELVKYKTIENARKEAIEQGIEEGIEQNQKANIINMLRKNLDIGLISEITGKSIKYISDLRKEI